MSEENEKILNAFVQKGIVIDYNDEVVIFRIEKYKYDQIKNTESISRTKINGYAVCSLDDFFSFDVMYELLYK